MTVFDRYLLRRYLYVFVIGYVSLFGLYFVVDVFSNVGDFLDQPGGALAILAAVAQHYSYRACYVFGAIGGTMEVVAAMVALALVQKYGELNPILSAGISTFRLLRPLLVGALLVNSAILVNQEAIIPKIAVHLQINAGSRSDVTRDVEPVLDFAADIQITAKRLFLRQRRLEEAEFLLMATKAATDLVVIRAREAYPVERRRGQPRGWLLKGTSIKHAALPLTELGRTLVREGASPDELFVRSDVTIDQLYHRDKNYELLSTTELMRRVRNPSFSQNSVRSQSLCLHNRLTKPLLNLIVIMASVPFVVRKESTSLVTNVAVCLGVLAAMFAVNQFLVYLGKVNMVSAETVVWTPIVLWGTSAAWASALVKT
jgi:lipopolysaccharide export system permease protein